MSSITLRRLAATDGFESSGFAVMRCAVLPTETLTRWQQSAEDRLPCARSATPQQRREALVRELKQIVQQPWVHDALYVASPSLCHDLDRWLHAEEGAFESVERAVTRYIQRMSGRSTPFGLFAALSIAHVAPDTSLQLGDLAALRTHTRLDNDYLFAITRSLESDPEIRRCLIYRPNSTLYFAGGRYRYVQITVDRTGRGDALVAADYEESIQAALDACRSGATLDTIAHALVERFGEEVTVEDALQYADMLAGQQLIVSDLGPLTTAVDPLLALLARLRPIPVSRAQRCHAVLSEVAAQLAESDRSAVGSRRDAYARVGEVLGALDTAADPSRLLHVDLYRSAPHADVGAPLVARVWSSVDLLYRISPPEPVDALRKFKDLFRQRYEQREMPLNEVLDEEMGIGYQRSGAAAAEDAPLLKGLPFVMAGDTMPRWTARDAYLLNRIEQLRAANRHVLDLTDEDIRRLTVEKRSPLPDALSAVVAVNEPENGGDDPDVLIKYVTGPSGANILGRFCHGDDELRRWVIGHLAREEANVPDAVFAEIVHVPSARMGNIAARPALRQYEIEFLGVSGMPEDRRLTTSDLLVSVQDDRVVLRAPRLGREVIPRMTNAHNFARGQGVYRFLGGVQAQHVSSWLCWSWGTLETLTFLPRIVRGPLVLCRAQWRFSDGAWAPPTTGSIDDLFAYVQQWRRQLQLPRFVALRDYDNELPLDLDNVLSVETFAHAVKRRGEFALVEMFPPPNHHAVRRDASHYAHEIVVPFTRIPTATSPRAPAAAAVVTVQRVFPPGSCWLFVKCYAGTATLDRLLTLIVGPFVNEHVTDGRADQWFFIRYSDPDWHLRLRFKGDPVVINGPLQRALYAALSKTVADGLAWKFQQETYEREIERYGGPAGIELSERYFSSDSDFVLALLGHLTAAGRLGDRWLYALWMWDRVLTSLGMTATAKLEFVRRQRRALGNTLGANKSLDHALGARFRSERRLLEHTLWSGWERQRSEIADVCLGAAERVSGVVADIRQSLERLSVPVESLASSFLHMHANRALRSSHQHHELVLYEFLARLYEAQDGRQRGRGAHRERRVVA